MSTVEQYYIATQLRQHTVHAGQLHSVRTDVTFEFIFFVLYVVGFFF